MTAPELPVTPTRQRRTGRLLGAGWPLLIWTAGALVFYRGPISSGFRWITGDDGDSRLIVYLHEHWIEVLRGSSPWRSPGFFYPTTGTLRNSDTFVLDEVFYAPLRLAGLDPYLAYQWTLITGSLVGFVGCYLLCRRILAGHPLLSSLLSSVFTFSNMLDVQAGHPQLSAVYWAPLVFLLAARWRSRPATAVGPAFGIGALVSLLLLSTYYVGWFLLFGAVLWGAACAVLARRGGSAPGRNRGPRALARQWGSTLRTAARPAAACLLGAAVALTPFLLVYLPQSGTGGRSLATALDYAAQPRDVLNLGRRNFLWGPLTRWLYGNSPRLSNGEFGFGLPLITLSAVLISTGLFVRRVRAPGAGSARDRIALATAIVALASQLLPIRIFGLSAWTVVWHLVPGAHAIRAIDRMAVLSGLLGVLVVAFAVAELLRNAAPHRTRATVAAAGSLLVLMVAEQFNTGTTAGIDRPAELARLAVIPPPPAACRSFFLIGVPTGRTGYAASIDAMAISQRVGLPTLNGFSGVFPAGFGALADPGATGYPAAVRQWVTDHQLTGVCSYDQSTRNWSLPGGQDGLK